MTQQILLKFCGKFAGFLNIAVICSCQAHSQYTPVPFISSLTVGKRAFVVILPFTIICYMTKEMGLYLL